VNAQGFLSFVMSTKSRKVYVREMVLEFLLVCKESDYHFLVMSVTLKLSYIWGTKAETL